MVRPAPISLRFRANEITGRARDILGRLDEADRMQRRVRLMALKAHFLIGEMDRCAEPRLKLLLSSDRERWQAEVKLIQSILLKISKRGA